MEQLFMFLSTYGTISILSTVFSCLFKSVFNVENIVNNNVISIMSKYKKGFSIFDNVDVCF